MGKAKSHFPAEFIQEMKAALVEKRAALLRNIRNAQDEMRASSEGHHLADMDDLGGDANDEETSFRILELESAELEQINHALDRIKEGTYGICEDTQEPIGVERLRALPFATLSIDAQRIREREEMNRR